MTEPYLLRLTHASLSQASRLALRALHGPVSDGLDHQPLRLVARPFTVLSFFIPILIGTGGNIGSQTVTTLIRAIGVGEVGPRHAALVFWKELRTGIMLGAVMAAAHVRQGSAGRQQHH